MPVFYDPQTRIYVHVPSDKVDNYSAFAEDNIRKQQEEHNDVSVNGDNVQECIEDVDDTSEGKDSDDTSADYLQYGEDSDTSSEDDNTEQYVPNDIPDLIDKQQLKSTLLEQIIERKSDKGKEQISFDFGQVNDGNSKESDDFDSIDLVVELKSELDMSMYLFSQRIEKLIFENDKRMDSMIKRCEELCAKCSQQEKNMNDTALQVKHDIETAKENLNKYTQLLPAFNRILRSNIFKFKRIK